MSDADNNRTKAFPNVTFTWFPVLVDKSHFEQFGPYQNGRTVLGSCDKRKNEEVSLTMAFESAERTIFDEEAGK